MVGLLGSHTPINPVVLPLFIFLVPFLHTPEQLEVIMATTRTTISNGPPYIGQTDADDIYAAFGELLQEPPPCIQTVLGTHGHIWNGVTESVKEILGLILARTLEDSARALLRWNGRPRTPSECRYGDSRLDSSGGEVSLETDGFGIENVERPYSCAASWAM
jgi:hypothetical protein